ncbi:MAG TPA: hypothetical protein VEZ89_08325 [Rubrivivax sp.]|nr:hypothetical protein [Rubrivivax sp.]
MSIYAARETPAVLLQTVMCALRGAAELNNAVVDVLVNGNPSLADELAASAALLAMVPASVRLRIWSFSVGDKAFTWSEYVHRIAPQATTSVFVDGYARVGPGAFASLEKTLAASPSALAVTGVPRYGRSARRLAEEMRAEGGLHGNLYALGSRAMAQLQSLNFRLPLGLYRTDSALGAALTLGLGLLEREWRPLERIALDENAAWEVDTLRWYRPADLRTWMRRRRRQSQGALENAALNQWYVKDRLPLESLPGTSAELIARWAAAAPEESAGLLKRYGSTARAPASNSLPNAQDQATHRCLLDMTGSLSHAMSEQPGTTVVGPALNRRPSGERPRS